MNASFVRYLRHLQRWESGTIRILGLIELLLAAALGVTAAYAAIIGEDSTLFSILFPIMGALGLFQYLFFSSKKKMTAALGVLLIAEMWAISFVVAAIPFMLYGFSPVDAFFEGISGYTTTGASILQSYDDLPRSLMLWRGVIQWAGGITVLISFSFLIPMLGMGGSGLNSNEFAGSDNDNYSLKISSASLNFLKVYTLLTVTEIFCLILSGVDSFDSVCISLSNIPTGGLLPRETSMEPYSFWAQAITLIFMILGSTNFYMMFRLIFKKDYALFKSRETRAMIKWFVGCSILVFLSFLYYMGFNTSFGNVGKTYWVALYAVVSSGTGTGFAVYSMTAYNSFALLILYIAEFMGGAAGSTAGGIKIYRMMAAKSYIMSNISRVMHPNAVVSIRSDGKNMGEDAVSSALSTIFLFVIGLILGLGLLMIFEDYSLEVMIGIVLAALTNAGIGPLDSYFALTVPSKIIMCFLMWLGRMEMVLVIIIFTRGFWSDVRLSVGNYKSGRNGIFRK